MPSALESRLFLPCGSQTASVLADSLRQARRVQGRDRRRQGLKLIVNLQLCLSSADALDFLISFFIDKTGISLVLEQLALFSLMKCFEDEKSCVYLV